MTLFEELKKRNVFRVAAAYAVVAWLLVQVADTIFPVFDVPQWLLRAIIVALLIGFPVALILAWIYELTPQGIQLSDSDSAANKGTAIDHRVFDFIVIGLLAAALLFVTLRSYVFDPLVHVDEPRASLAVLAFDNLGGDPQQEYLAGGISEELITALAAVPEIRVASRTSSFTFKGTKTDVSSIAAALNVHNVLEGSIRFDGDRLRVTAQLVDAATDSHIWAESYDRELDDIFAIQDDIALRVSEALRLELLGDDAVPSLARHTGSLDAYDAFLRGIHAQRRGLPAENLHEAARHYRQAIALDPSFARAHARLAGIYIGLGNFRLMVPADAYRQALDHVNEALAIDDTIADGHAMRGWVRLSYQWDWAGAEESFRRSIALAPSLFSGHQGLSFVLALQGDLDGALTAAEMAYELDPLSAYSIIALVEVRYKRREFGETLRWQERLLDISPDSPQDLVFAGLVKAHNGDPEYEVMRFVEEARSAAPDDGTVNAFVAIVYAQLGRAAAARQMLERVVAQRDGQFVSAGLIAAAYAALGQAEEAMGWLTIAEQEYDSMIFGLNYPEFDGLRSNPGFVDLVENLGLPADAYR